MKRVAIVQSSYVPWKGYFDLIRAVDEFILYDDVQYTRRDWRNRNRIKTARGIEWLTIPVVSKGRYTQKIRETRVQDASWSRRHWSSLEQSYGRSMYFGNYRERIAEAYRRAERESLLSRINRVFIDAICGILGVDTRITWSMDYEAGEGKTERLVDLCRRAGASHYLSGPSARDYLDADLFAEGGIVLEYADYSGYPEYPQLHGPFEHRVSVLDLIFNAGPEAARYLKALA